MEALERKQRHGIRFCDLEKKERSKKRAPSLKKVLRKRVVVFSSGRLDPQGPLPSPCVVFLLLFGVMFVTVSGWNDCVVSPEDRWKLASEDTPALRMRREYERRYTCSDEEASFMAASYYFDSPCMAKTFFFPPAVHSCLKGRRVIFVGDSLSNQQGDSLLGMLGWHPPWMKAGDPRNGKQAVDENGKTYFTLVDCWRPHGGIAGVERCYDYSSRDFPSSPPLERASADRHHDAGDDLTQPYVEGRLERHEEETAGTTSTDAAAVPGGSAGDHDRRFLHRRARGLGGDEGGGEVGSGKEGEAEGEAAGVDSGGDDADEDADEDEEAISVHMRMVSVPRGEHWFYKAVFEFNGTRPSDVFVVNFGAHYHDFPEEDEEFKRDVFPILDDMAELGKDATVIWREIAPAHFPAEGGSYDAFASLDQQEENPCCTGVPPKILDRNVWVENYLRDNGYEDRVKLLRIYDMSATRGAAHHTCNLAPPSTMDQSTAKSDNCRPPSGSIDCRHWSETGVMEEWNALLLSHICPSVD